MMRQKLLRAVIDPYFKLTLIHGVNGLITSAKVLESLGIDVKNLIAQALKEVSLQLNEAAYEITNLDELLHEAQAIGDEVVQTQSTEATSNKPRTPEKDGDSGKGNFGKSD